MKSKWLKYIGLTLLALFLTIGVPILINESYKVGAGYVTMWEAADVLAYYGTLLGAAAAVWVLKSTVSFTARQLIREHFLKIQYAKWEKVDEIIMQTLQEVSPLNMISLDSVGNTPTTDKVSKLIMTLQTYALKAKTSISVIKCYVTPDDYKKIEYFINELCQAIALFCGIEDELVQVHLQFQQILTANNGLAPDESMTAYTKQIADISQRIVPAYENDYQKLYDIKRDIFACIYSEIDKQADQILKFGRKRGKSNAHT